MLAVSALRRAVLSARTLKPSNTASLDSASVTSDSEIGPTPELMTRTLTSSVDSSFKAANKASSEPRTSVLRTIFKKDTSPCCICSNILSRRILFWRSSCCSRSRLLLKSATSRAFFSSETTKNSLPAAGVSGKPKISTGIEGPADLIRWPFSSVIARTLP